MTLILIILFSLLAMIFGFAVGKDYGRELGFHEGYQRRRTLDQAIQYESSKYESE